MSIRIGLYDFFAYTLPGIFYLSITLFGLSILGFAKLDLTALNSVSPSVFLLVLGAAYIFGVLLDTIAYRWARLFYGNNGFAVKQAFADVQKQHPWLNMNFEPADWNILLRAIKSQSIEVAADVEQHNVANIMMRNISFGLVILSVIFILYFFLASRSMWNVVLFGCCISLSVVALRRSRIRRHWFYTSIFEAFVAQHLPKEISITANKNITKIEPTDFSET